MELTIVCCLWGDWPEDGWGGEYVRRLRDGVRRNLKLPHRFVCIADDLGKVPFGIEALPLNSPIWDGCLPKLNVYDSAYGFEGRVLLLDLDNVITGDLTSIASYQGDYAVRAWFAGYDRGRRVPDGDMIGFQAGGFAATALWEKFSASPQGALEVSMGRERRFIKSILYPDLWQDELPTDYIVSYKRHVRRRGLRPENSIVSFHDGGVGGGDFRPHKLEQTVSWLQDHWY